MSHVLKTEAAILRGVALRSLHDHHAYCVSHYSNKKFTRTHVTPNSFSIDNFINVFVKI